jgi:hypothetical protein
MDWDFIIDKQSRALRLVLAALVAMAGLTGDNPVLPRRLYRKVLAILRPAESAARRLIVMSARGITVALPPPRKPVRRPRSIYVRPGRGTGVVVPWGVEMPDERPRPAAISLPVVDPPYRIPRPRRTGSGVPRIRFLDQRPDPARPAPLPVGLVDATRLGQRLDALRRVLDDLPRQALRLARWKARCAAGLVKRLSPLRPGRAYGTRGKHARRPVHGVDEILLDTHYFAREALALDMPVMRPMGGA